MLRPRHRQRDGLSAASEVSAATTHSNHRGIPADPVRDRLAVGRELADGQLVRILPEYGVPEEGATYIVHPSSRHVPNKTRAFTDWISEGFSRDLSWRR